MTEVRFSQSASSSLNSHARDVSFAPQLSREDNTKHSGATTHNEERSFMAQEPSLTREAFLYLAAQAGLDVSSPHMDELYPYAENALAGLRSLDAIDVSEVEPDMAFRPSPDQAT